MTEATIESNADNGAGTGKRRAVFHTLEVSGVRKLTEKAIEVSFAVPEDLQSEYDYAAGQYVALRATIDGQEVRRSYSICEAPTPGTIKVGIKRDLGGLFSNWANDNLEAGFEMDVMSPQGVFVSKHQLTGMNDADKVSAEAVADGASHFVAAAAGSGITPVIAIAKSLLEHPNTQVDLIYANRAASDVMFLEDLADLKDRYPTRLAVHHVLSREQRQAPIYSGRLDAEKLSQLFEYIIDVPNVDEWFLCGPFELVQLVRDELSSRDVPDEKVRFELFSTGQPGEGAQSSAGRPVEVDPEGDNFEISFVLDGLSGEVKSPKDARETVLNAALRVRPDVPFACAGGVCGTCRAKVTLGSVDMAENYALEKDDVANGYVLTCQSRPTTDKVAVDFDA
ncbi:1,2-phenylacetyl-CoA epoxidase subunit PaaE [Gulosibacter molinativorax]|uniref:Phenylacetate-CoA oxygenase/reductase subunit PaaK n=1 Tax=Gulosibacter molinativorax TaxID=256821 RepID=A0ABT7C5H5_9MICO|nr:1,2-phenylacetyl-CoA epoxidase subunit PaaE [Gulosibacter molinativorax]MDJ1370445.1 phenylacetate-CoA oxygenase/reductase subunit PaaK [Gulosibacter molinativorax]QUY61358.1 Phenylacetate-CoA oxygenase subunit PaaK [Gulosibacter molinativorax]